MTAAVKRELDSNRYQNKNRWDRRGGSDNKTGTKTQTKNLLAVILEPLMIKWLISQKVRAVNTSSKTTKKTEIQRRKEKLKGGVCVCGSSVGDGDGEDESHEEKNQDSQNGSEESLERTLCAQIEALGMSISLTNMTVCVIMRQHQQKPVGDEKGKGPGKTIFGHA